MLVNIDFLYVHELKRLLKTIKRRLRHKNNDVYYNFKFLSNIKTA